MKLQLKPSATTLILIFALVAVPASIKADVRGLFISPTTGVTVGTVWGVFIGLSKYQQHDLNLEYADKDAEALHKFFVNHFTGSVPPDHFKLLVNQQATRGAILQAVGEVLRLAQPEDVVLISMALHGLPEMGGNDLYFLSYDADASHPEDRGISQYDIYKQINRSKARKIILFFDACHAAAFGSSPSLLSLRSAGAAEVNKLLVAMGQAQDGVAVMSSSSAAEQSQEGKQFCDGHGAFTCALLKGLKGDADSDKNGLVQIRELFDYTYREVKRMTVGYQHPAIEGRYDNGLPLATAPLVPNRPNSSANGGAAKKDIDLGDYEKVQALADYQSKMEQAWKAVKSISTLRDTERKSSLNLLDKFVKDFPIENPHLSELEELRKTLQNDSMKPTAKAAEDKPNGGVAPKTVAPGQESKGIEVAALPSYQIQKSLKKEVVGKDGALMVLIPAGDFLMGSDEWPDERPQHRVRLDDFYMDIYEVTTGLYNGFLTSTGHSPPYKWEDYKTQRDDHKPVIGVNWFDANAYCRWAGKRLPTEAEWEKAARGVDGRKYPWGNEPPTESHGNFGHCCGWKGYLTLNEVGTSDTGKSPYGVFDLTGNVWEWTADWYANNYYKTSPVDNPTGPSTGDRKVIRGGSWSNSLNDLRVVARDKLSPSYKNMSLGFRCVSDLMSR